jgi:hypothetical protein
VRLEPWVEGQKNQKDWSEVVLYRICERTKHFLALRLALLREFGTKVDPRSDDARTFDEEMLLSLKTKADAVEERISAQLHDAAKAQAIREGRIRPDDDDE